MTQPTDRFNLQRFVLAQDGGVYEQALSEIRAGAKRSHWIWFIFPQLLGLASSEMSVRYAIRSLDEARAYLDHPILGVRLKTCALAAMEVKDRSALVIFGSPDDMKLRSCATLFARVSEPGNVFDGLLTRYFDGQPDERTLDLLSRAAQAGQR